MADSEDIFLRAQHRTFSGLTEDAESKWTGPFFFIQAADPQLGLMKAWKEGDYLVHAMPALPKAACRQILHPEPGCFCQRDQRRGRWKTPRSERVRSGDLKKALKEDGPLHPTGVRHWEPRPGEHPTPGRMSSSCSAWGNDYFSFWVGGVLCLVLNSQLFHDASACPQLKEAQETWLEEQLSRASSSAEPKPKHVLVFQHIPLYLKTPDEEDDYFNLKREVRQSLERFKRAAVRGFLSSESEPLHLGNATALAHVNDTLSPRAQVEWVDFQSRHNDGALKGTCSDGF
ncbi:hypothetical protein KUCAC02_013248, partial [Chaenocephalus aceratus]